MKKVIALVFSLGLFFAAPAMAAEDSILTSVSQDEIATLADTEMSMIQGELLLGLSTYGVHVNLLGLVVLHNPAIKVTAPQVEAILGTVNGLLASAPALLLGLLGGLL